MIIDLHWICQKKNLEDIKYINGVAPIYCLNMNTWSILNNNREYREVYYRSYVICDGFWVHKALKLLGIKIELIPGPSFLYESFNSSDYKTHVLLGSTEEVAVGVKDFFKKNNDENRIKIIPIPFVGIHDFNYQLIAQEIISLNPDYAWISLGAPRQELFCDLLVRELRVSAKTNTKIVVSAVGAAFDFYSTNSAIRRAPLIFRSLGLEWLWRIFKQPKKTINRLGNELFFVMKLLYFILCRKLK